MNLCTEIICMKPEDRAAAIEQLRSDLNKALDEKRRAERVYEATVNALHTMEEMDRDAKEIEATASEGDEMEVLYRKILHEAIHG